MIEEGKKYKTRDGREVKNLCRYSTGCYTWVGYIKGDALASSWTDEGRYYIEVLNKNDLILDEQPIKDNEQGGTGKGELLFRKVEAGGLKYDTSKPDYSLLNKEWLDQVAYALMAGEKKYGRYNYKQGFNSSRLTAAAMRHVKQYENGEDLDVECSDLAGQKVSHLACAIVNLAMALELEANGKLTDDRYKKEEDKEDV